MAPSFPFSILCQYLSTHMNCLKRIIVDKDSVLGLVFPCTPILFHSQNASTGKPMNSLFPTFSDILFLESEAQTCNGIMKRKLPPGIS